MFLHKPRRAAVKYLKSVSEARFQKRRVKLPEEDYKPGSPIGNADPSILWSEPNDAGLSLGISGVANGEKYPKGQSLRWRLYIRNEAKEAVKLSASDRYNDGLRAWLTDASGVKHHFRKPGTGPRRLLRYRIDPAHYIKLESSRPYFPVTPGKYRLEVENRIGQWPGISRHTAKDDPGLVPGLGEWTGTLTTKPLEIVITTYQVAIVVPGSPKLEYLTKTAGMEMFYARVRFEKGKITVARGRRPLRRLIHWSPPHDEWKSIHPTGDYVAARELGAARKLWVVDGTRILCLVMVDTLVERGRWTLDEASGDLGGMSRGVRQALKLPPKANPEPSGDAATG